MQTARNSLFKNSMIAIPIAIQNKIKPTIRFIRGTSRHNFKGFLFVENRVYYRVCHYMVNLNIIFAVTIGNFDLSVKRFYFRSGSFRGYFEEWRMDYERKDANRDG
jgi:hypothetical protein